MTGGPIALRPYAKVGGSTPIIEVWAARGFEAPDGRECGPCEGVYIADHGAGNATPAALGRSLPPDAWNTGCPVWNDNDTDPAGPLVRNGQWAIVDQRFVIQGSRSLMAEVLARRGDRHALLEWSGPTPGLDWSACDLVFCKPRPPGFVVRDRPMILVASDRPWRTELWSTDEGQFDFAYLPERRTSERRAGVYAVIVRDLEAPDPRDEDSLRGMLAFSLAVGFGFLIFI